MEIEKIKKQAMRGKKVVLKTSDFEKIVRELEKCRSEKDALKEALDYLNAQIEEYNEKFAKEDDG
ncbi:MULTISPECIES: hypothetical protein [unclassified Nitratiruptor]|uniref:hypothetical protein n=1 Tax=unclassified Nitratiruptor TaxID=2624044 RepID=UPI0019167328|nr:MULTISPECIES: hypothetical protein [unclassified Nitratiruptor]